MDDKTLAAISTPIRDLRDEVWCRVYAECYGHVRRAKYAPDLAAQQAAMEADAAVARMSMPHHRRPEGA